MIRYDGTLEENPYGNYVNYWDIKGLLDELKEYLHEIDDCRDRQGNYITDELNKIINKEETN